MKMKIILIISMAIFISSCSYLSNINEGPSASHSGRFLSSLKIQKVENASGFISQLDKSEQERFISVLEVYEWRGGEYVGLGHREVQWGQAQEDNPVSFRLDSHDTILQIEVQRDFLLVRSFFGVLLKINKFGVEVVQAGFPVASFEYVDGILHLYNKNSQGRFCDQEELKRAPAERDPSCELVAAKLVLD